MRLACGLARVLLLELCGLRCMLLGAGRNTCGALVSLLIRKRSVPVTCGEDVGHPVLRVKVDVHRQSSESFLSRGNMNKGKETSNRERAKAGEDVGLTGSFLHWDSLWG